MIILAFVIAVAVALLLGKIIFKGTRTILGIIINIAVGTIALWILSLFSIGVVITWYTALIVGLLGLPGVGIVLLITYLL